MANSAAAAGMPVSRTADPKSMQLLFVEMGTGYDQHGCVWFFFSSLRLLLGRLDPGLCSISNFICGAISLVIVVTGLYGIVTV